jgi:hypothetical protein
MGSRLSIHRADRFSLGTPGLLGPVLAAGLGAALTVAFGILSTAALTNRYPGWLRDALLFRLEAPEFRAALIVVGFFNLVVALLVALGFGNRALNLLGYRLGWVSVRETEGACLVVEEHPGVWELCLDLDAPAEEERIAAVAGDAVSGPRSVPLGEPGWARVLRFRMDEGAAATVCRLFNPGERLRLRWLDLPPAAGGAVLLEVRSPARARQLIRETDSAPLRRAA